MSRGKNNGFRRGRENRTLAWYLDSKTLNRVDSNQERDNFSPSMMQGRKNSFDSESSLNSNGQKPNIETDERKKRANKIRGNRQRSNNSQTFGGYIADSLNRESDVTEQRSDPIPIQRDNVNEVSSVGSDQQSAVLQQHLLALSAQAVATQKENYWYYDSNSQGFYYELCGSRGWRKFNPKLHGNPPLSVNKPTEEATVAPGTQTIEKVYVPIPVPIFTNSSKFFPQAGTSPNIKYDPSSDGLFYETASVDGWKKRNPGSSSSLHGMVPTGQSPRVEPSSLASFPPLGRDLTSNELEELILARVKSNSNMADKNPLPFASVVSRGLNKHIVQRQSDPDYPSSSSTVSSSVSSDDVTPPPANMGKENQCHQLFAQTKEPVVGSFEEPYEFYWSDNEKPENVQQQEQASSVSSADELNSLSAYFNDISLQKEANRQNIRVQRPSSLKIVNPAAINNGDKRLPNFNIDRFIADLPGNDNFMNMNMYASFGTDSPRTPFNQCMFTKESPMFTPMLPKENTWSRFSNFKQEEYKALAESSIERGIKDIEAIWN